jgi:PAS domain S-box-containing protein
MPDPQCDTYLTSKGGVNAQLFEGSSDCIKIFDLNGRLLQMNPGGASVLELDNQGQLIGQDWVDLWPEESKRIVSKAISTACAGDRFQFDAFCPTAKGTPLWWNVVVTPMFDHAGKVHQLMGVSRDVTELHLAKEALQEEIRRKDIFLTMLAHELRTPLSATSMAAQILTTENSNADHTMELGHLISRQVGHMSRLVEDLLDISRVIHGEISLELKPVAMADIVKEAAEQVQGTVAAKGHTLNLVLCNDDCSVLGDRTRLVQIVANLMGNAARYTPDGGCITVKLKRQRENVTLSVSDTGIGITPNRIPELFELYQQEVANNDRGSGLGVGLALVRKFIELHGGHVFAFSAGEGKGSTFTLKIPASS